MSYELIKDYFTNNLDIKHNFDIFKKNIKLENREYILYYLTSLIDPVQFDCLIDSIINSKDFYDIFHLNRVSSITNLEDIETSLFFLYSGAVILFSELEQKIISIDIRKYPTRGISEPDIEKGIRTSKDGFSETLIFNIALIRKRIKSSALKIEHYMISSYSKNSVALIYMDDFVDKKILSLIKSRLENININSLVMQEKALEEVLLIKNNNLFPLIRYSERPDVTSINILNGKIILLIDNSPVALILPSLFFDHFRHIEEYKESYIIGSFTRFLRSISIFLSVFLFPLFICLVSDKDITNNFINISLNSDITTPLSIQVISSYLIIEIIRIASIHLSSSFLTSLSLVSALILGDISISLNLFSLEIVFISAFSSICNLATPSYELSLSNRFISLILIIISLAFGFDGFLIGLIVIFMYLVSIKSFDKPYLYPLVPFNAEDFLHLFFPKSSKNKKMF